MVRILMLFFLLVSCGDAMGQAKSFMPENDLNLYDSFTASNMTEQEFNSIISDAEQIYKPIVAQFGARFAIERDWNDSTVNAYAYQQNGGWFVKMFGGMARRPEMTSDGFRLVVCHEIGHHLGGFPVYQGDWASNEGQSDYFAPHVCFRKMIDRSVDPISSVEPKVTADCNGFWQNSKNRYICKRGMMGGLSLARLLGALGGTAVDINRKDPSVVSRTSDAHPAAQCRLDTMVAAALCKNSWNDRVIPRSAAQSYSCNNRPRCWYAP